MKTIIISSLFLSLFATGVSLGQGTVTVNVSGMKNNKGMAKLSLFNSAEGFPNDDNKTVKWMETPIAGGTSRFVLENIPAGTYAIGVFHDENGNHKFDTNFMGIPKEAYGMTNNVRGGVGGSPKFDPAKITIPKTGVTLAIVVK